MQAVTLAAAIIALLLAVYAALVVSHLPTHVHENVRIKQVEIWVRNRCAGVTVPNACLEIQKIEPPKREDVFRLPH